MSTSQDVNLTRCRLYNSFHEYPWVSTNDCPYISNLDCRLDICTIFWRIHVSILDWRSLSLSPQHSWYILAYPEKSPLVSHQAVVSLVSPQTRVYTDTYPAIAHAAISPAIVYAAASPAIVYAAKSIVVAPNAVSPLAIASILSSGSDSY